MELESQRPKDRGGAISALNAATKALSLAEKASSITPIKTVFVSVNALLAMIRDSTADEQDYVELGLSCADVCRVLERRTKGKKPDELTQSVYDAINQLTLIVANIDRTLAKWGKRSPVSRLLHARSDKETIAAWWMDLDKILQVFSGITTSTSATGSIIRHDVVDTPAVVPSVRNDVVNTHTVGNDDRRDTSKGPMDAYGQGGGTHASAPGDSPPPLQGSMHGPVSDTRHDTVRARSIASEVRRYLGNIHTIVSDFYGDISRGGASRNSIPGRSQEAFSRSDYLFQKMVDFIIGVLMFTLVIFLMRFLIRSTMPPWGRPFAHSSESQLGRAFSGRYGPNPVLTF